MHADNTKTSPITIITYTHIYVLVSLLVCFVLKNILY